MGCPAAAYLAGAGVGTVGLIDGDKVETSNLHRQIIHNTTTIGKFKVDSAIEYLQELNSLCEYIPHRNHLQPESAIACFEDYDIILDCTDHPTSRYLISDAAVIADIPLISASALGTEGQLLVLNHSSTTSGQPQGKFCYRCVFKKPPPPDTVLSCAEGGILGPVVGTMGTLMATEALRILSSPDLMSTEGGSGHGFETPEPSMLLYSYHGSPTFRTVKLAGKKPNCPSCSANPSITRESLNNGSMDYIKFCGLPSSANVLRPHERMSPSEYIRLTQPKFSHQYILLDVRTGTEFKLCNIPGSINLPIRALSEDGRDEGDEDLMQKVATEKSILTICRHGNDSQIAAKILRNQFGDRIVGDIKGGLEAWRKEVDPSFPDY